MKQGAVFAIALAALVLSSASARSEESELPSYQRMYSVTGVIHVWGNSEMSSLLERWRTGFRKFHPHARIEAKLTGSDIAMAGLYTSLADIALLGRECTASDAKAFEWIFRYRPERVEIATGSFDLPGKSPPLVAFVHRENPLARLTLMQLDAIFSHERRRGADARISTWGDLGLKGVWADRTIKLYADDTERGTGRYFRHAVLGDSRMLNWEHLTEFTDSSPLRRPMHDESRQVLSALSADRYGLAITGRPAELSAQVKTIALPAADGDFVEATRGNLISGRYPLTRTVSAYINHRPGERTDSRVGEFLRYVLSREGQRDVVDGGEYLPLDREKAQAQMSRLK